jgi:hypothetical protein
MYQARKRADQCLGPAGWRHTGCRRRHYPHRMQAGENGALLVVALRAWASMGSANLRLDWVHAEFCEPQALLQVSGRRFSRDRFSGYAFDAWGASRRFVLSALGDICPIVFGCTDLSRVVERRERLANEAYLT